MTSPNNVLKSRNVIWAAVHQLATNDVPVGFEAQEQWDFDNNARVSLDSGTVGEILDSIIAQDTTYTWEEIGGVIYIYPVRGRFEKSVRFLAARVGPFIVYKGDDREAIVERFSNLFADRGRKGLVFASRIYRGHASAFRMNSGRRSASKKPMHGRSLIW